MKWPRIGDIIAFRQAKSGLEDAERGFSIDSSADGATSKRGGFGSDAESWRRLKFDNAVRLWVAIPTFLTCFALRTAGAIDSILPIAAVILGYAIAIFVACTLFFNTRFHRIADYLLILTDLTAMSVAVYLTGAAASPLYFIYFVPVVIHAFHRDWDLILFSGFGGVVFYGTAIFIALPDASAAAVADLFARIIFMLLTVAVTCLALSVLRKEEQRQIRQISRLRAAASIGHRLNTACSKREIVEGAGEISILIASGLERDLAVQLIFDGSTPSGTAVPIATTGGEPFGAVIIGTSSNQVPSKEDLSFVKFIARAVALSMRRHEMIDELGQSVEMATAVAAIYLAGDRSIDAARSSCLEGGAALLKADGAALYNWSDETNGLDVVAWWGAFNREAVSGGQTEVILSSTFEDAQVRSLDDGRTLVLPLATVGEHPTGVIVFQRISGAPFSPEQTALATAFVYRSAHAVSDRRPPHAGSRLSNRLAA